MMKYLGMVQIRVTLERRNGLLVPIKRKYHPPFLIGGQQAMSTSIYSIDRMPAQREWNNAAASLSPLDRQALALDALSGPAPISELSQHHQVSRKFIYQQKNKAQEALGEAFDPSLDEEKVLFELPVTKAWLQQVVLSLVLVGRSSFRGVIEFFDAVLDHPIALGSVHNIVQGAVAATRPIQAGEDLSSIQVGAHDEIFQSHHPTLVGCDVVSTFCYLLTQEDHRDAVTWGVHLLDLQEKGLDLDHTIGDGGKGLRAGQALAFDEVPCWGDHFHLLQELYRLSTYAENRAFRALTTCEQLEGKMRRAKRKAKRHTLSKKLTQARHAQQQAIELADEIALLVEWLHNDILSVVGPDGSTRQELYDWIVECLRTREHQLPHRITPVRRLLENGRDDFLAFAHTLDSQLEALADRLGVETGPTRALFEIQALPLDQPLRWQREGALRGALGKDFAPLKEEITQLIDATVRASSVVENLNSRLRNYFFLRKQIGPEYLELLRFFLNHRRFMRSEHPERVGKSPAEILTGQEHPHWLEMLGFKRFKKSA